MTLLLPSMRLEAPTSWKTSACSTMRWKASTAKIFSIFAFRRSSAIREGFYTTFETRRSIRSSVSSFERRFACWGYCMG